VQEPTLCAPIKSSPLYFSGSWRSCFRFCPENCEQLRTRGAELEAEVTRQSANDATARRLSALIASAEDAIISTTLTGIVESWNDGAQRLFGYMAAATIGRNVAGLLGSNGAEEDAMLLERLLPVTRKRRFLGTGPNRP
jgi:PAS domain-containing protein